MEMSIALSVKENGKKSPKYTLESDLNGEITLEDLLYWTKTALLQISLDTLKEEQARGFDKQPVTRVDGRLNKKIENVAPLGKIQFNSRVEDLAVLAEIYAGIMERSKRVTGQYIESNFVFVGGVRVATNPLELATYLEKKPEIKPGTPIHFVNIAPYARKLERLGVTAQRQQNRRVEARGKKKRPGSTVTAANGVYFLTQRAIRRKYKANAKILFKFIPGSELGLAGSFRLRKGQSSRNIRTYLYPAIIVQFSPGGVL